MMKKWIIAFLVGLGLIGVGGGIAFGEITSVQYRGEKEVVTDGEYVNKSQTFTLEEGVTMDKVKVETERSTQVEKVVDDTLDDRTIRFAWNELEGWTSGYVGVSYIHDANAQPDEETGELPISRQSFDVYWQEDERFVLGMLKTVMDDLKHKEVYQYEVGGFRKVTIYANSKVLNSIQVNQY